MEDKKKEERDSIGLLGREMSEEYETGGGYKSGRLATGGRITSVTNLGRLLFGGVASEKG